MNSIKSSIFSVFTVCITGGLLKTFGTNEKYEKAISYIISLITVICILLPFKSVLPEMENTLGNLDFESPTRFQEPPQTESVKYIIKKIISENFEINEENINLTLKTDTNTNETNIEEIDIELKSYIPERKINEIKTFLEEQTKCKIKVIKSYG